MLVTHCCTDNKNLIISYIKIYQSQWSFVYRTRSLILDIKVHFADRNSVLLMIIQCYFECRTCMTFFILLFFKDLFLCSLYLFTDSLHCSLYSLVQCINRKLPSAGQEEQFECMSLDLILTDSFIEELIISCCPGLCYWVCRG